MQEADREVHLSIVGGRSKKVAVGNRDTLGRESRWFSFFGFFFWQTGAFPLLLLLLLMPSVSPEKHLYGHHEAPDRDPGAQALA